MYNISQDSDKEEIKALWAYAFNEQEPFLSSYFDNFYNSADVLATRTDGKISSSLQMIPYSICIRNRLFSSSYVAWVSVAKEQRGKKLSTALMKECILLAKERGESFSLLIPFSCEFYKKLGYSLCYSLSLHELSAENIPAFETKHIIREVSEKEADKLNIAYTEYTKDKNGYNIRKHIDWEYIFFEHKLFNGHIFASFKDEHITGYVSYLETKKEIFVREFIYTDTDSLHSLLAFIKSNFCQKETIKIRTANDNVLFSLLKEPKNTLKIQPTVMARITNIESVLMCADTEDLKIKVFDELIEENNRVYEKINGKIIGTKNENFDVSIDIGSLTQLVSGFSSAKELLLKGQLFANDETIEKLERIFPKQNNYINHIMEE